MDPNYLDLKPKLSELQKYLIPAACEKREAIGIALGLADDDDGEFLDELNKKHTSEKYLLEVLKKWLRTKPATWKSILKVLKSQDLNDVAMKIKSHFCEDDRAMPLKLNQSIPEALPLEQPGNMDNLDQPEPMILQRDYSVHMKEGCKIRSYQEELAAPGIKGENYIIIAPTGSGKTLVAARVISDHLQKNQGQEQPCHGIFVVNTKPLAEQQKDELKSFLPAARVEVYTGDNPGTLAESIKHNNDISVCTAGKFLDEVKKGLVKFDQLSLIVFDECHHTRKGHPYARLMEHFLEFKEKQGAVLPQIIGMTASPGAGENENLDRTKTIEHLKRLAALMNARGGFKTVTENIAELQESTKNSSYTYKILRPRDHKNDSFIDLITAEMKVLESCVPGIKISVQRWAQEYETIVQQNKQKYELSSDEGMRDHISTLNALRCYSNALYIYMDLRQEDAIKEIRDYASDGFPADDVNATPRESDIKSRMLFLLNNRFKHLPPRPNPMLENMATILRDNFEGEPTSRAILFVRTKKHVHSIKDWVCSHKNLHSVKPDVITGHTRETGSGMTQVEQEAVMDRFRKGSSNLLIATSVAEEGLDVPKCNLVIRYQHVSNEIALVQTEGRARAENSQGITILPCDSRKMLRELKNKELIELVDDILEKQHIPSGRHLERELTCIQKEIVIRRRRKAALRLECKRSHTADEVRLLCKTCKEFACSGSDVHTIEAGEGHHYVVPAMDSDKYTTKPHPKPRDIVLDTVKKTEKVFCKCGRDWGVKCIWPAKGDSYPVIKCSAFIFKIKGAERSFKKWGDVPFTMETLDDYWLKKDASSDTDSSD